jgi:putative ABC transport system permease protein
VNLKNPGPGVMSARDIEDWSPQARTMAAFGAWRDWSFSRSTVGGRERYLGIIATPGLFAVLGLEPVLGRTYTDDENRTGAGVLLLSERVWRTRFGADPLILGRTLSLSRAPHGERPFTVIGIMPDVDLPSFTDAEFWAPSAVDEDAGEGRWLRNRRVWGRLAATHTLPEAAAELQSLAAQTAAAFPDSHSGWTVDVQPVSISEVGSARGALLFFATAIALVLLVGCANVAGLLVARATGRAREFAIRTALGSEPRHIVKLVLAEAVVLGVLAGIASVLVRLWLMDLIVSMGPDIPRMASPSPWSTLAITFGVSTVAVVMAGALPAWQAARLGSAETMRIGGRSATGQGTRVRAWLVAVQITVALMLLTGAAAAGRTVRHLLAPPEGYDPSGVVITQLFPATSKYADRDALVQLVSRIIDDVGAMPGITAVSTVSAGPLFGGEELVEVGRPEDAGGTRGQLPQARFFDVSPGYFRTLGVTLVEGRDLSERDAAGTPPVAVINETLARRLWPGERAVGQRVVLPREARALEVVGVVSDFPKRAGSPETGPEIYWPYRQQPRWAFYVVARSNLSADALVAPLRSRLAGLDPDLAPARVSTLESLRSRATRADRFAAVLLGLFAGCALLLAALGTYGLVNHAAAQRTREIGIRISFGAAPSHIRRLILGQVLTPVALGTVAGLASTILVARVTTALVPGLSRPDAATLALATVVLLTAAVCATVLPVRRATRVDPVTVLSTE